MLNPRILVAFSAQQDADLLLDMLLSALAHAGKPFGLRFAVPARFDAALADAAFPAGTFTNGDIKFYDDARGLAGLWPAVTDETHLLYLKGSYAFSERWDTVLLSRYRKISAPRALMTAVINGEGETAQACLPAFTGGIDEHAAHLGAGIPLVCSNAPASTLIAYPLAVFSLITLLRDIDPAEDSLSILAYAAGYSLHALDCTPFWPTGRKPRAVKLAKPGPEALPPTVIARYEQLAGISFEQRSVSLRAKQGLFTVTNSYPQRLPVPLTLRRQTDRLLRGARATMPLFVTAFIDLPDALKPPQSYMIRFDWLRALERLPLTLYAGGEMERHLRSVFPNTLAYPDHSLLERSLLGEGMTPMQFFRRNKLLLMQRTLRTFPTSSHIAWIDIDALPHPVCPQAEPDCTALMDDRIHLGWVGGEPDTSFMVIPRNLFRPLVREVQSITQLDTDMKRSFAERELYRRLLEQHPDWFTLHPLPVRELLFLTCLNGELLSASVKQNLCDLPEPIRCAIAPSEGKGSDEHARDAIQ